MVDQLPRDRLAEMAGADDDRVLEIEDVLAAVRSGGEAQRDGRSDGEEPEQEELAELGAELPRQPRRRVEEERPDGDEVEDAGEIVGRRVVRAFLVAVVQA